MIRKEDINLLAQLIDSMRDVTDRIDKYYLAQDMVNLEAAKKEFLDLQAKIDKLV